MSITLMRIVAVSRLKLEICIHREKVQFGLYAARFESVTINWTWSNDVVAFTGSNKPIMTSY